MSQVRFNVQVLSSLINSNSKLSIQQQKPFHVRVFESQCSLVFRCVFGFEKFVDVFLSPSSSDKHTKSYPHIFVWVAEQDCNVCASSESSQLSKDQSHVVKLLTKRRVLSCLHNISDDLLLEVGCI